MYKVIKKSEASLRIITENKRSLNFITKNINPEVSLAITEGEKYFEEEIAKYNRIYFVLEGQLILTFDKEKIILEINDCCYIDKGTKYTMSGTFKTIVVNQPAFGT